MKFQESLLSLTITLILSCNLFSQQENLYAIEVTGTVYKSVSPKEELKPGYSFANYAQLTFAEKDAMVFYTDTKTNSNFSLDYWGNTTPIDDTIGDRLQEKIEDSAKNGKRLPSKSRKELRNATGEQGQAGNQNN